MLIWLSTKASLTKLFGGLERDPSLTCGLLNIGIRLFTQVLEAFSLTQLQPSGSSHTGPTTILMTITTSLTTKTLLAMRMLHTAIRAASMEITLMTMRLRRTTATRTSTTPTRTGLVSTSTTQLRVARSPTSKTTNQLHQAPSSRIHSSLFARAAIKSS